MEEMCEWTYQEFHHYWDTQCGQAFVLTDGTPGDNNMHYCCYCGRPLVEGEPRPEWRPRAKVVK